MAEPVDIDANAQRERAIASNGLQATDEAWTFYYDKTNNHRLVHLTNSGFNVPDPRPFVLGCVVHPGPRKPIDLTQLRRSMGIQPGAPEVKYEMVAKGGGQHVHVAACLDIDHARRGGGPPDRGPERKGHASAGRGRRELGVPG